MTSIDIPMDDIVFMVTDRGTVNWMLGEDGSFLTMGSKKVAVRNTAHTWREAYNQLYNSIAKVDVSELNSLGFRDQDGVWAIAYEQGSGRTLQSTRVIRTNQPRRELDPIEAYFNRY